MVSSNQNGLNRLAKVFTLVIDIQTYKNALYLLVAFPLGFIYTMVLGFEFIFGIGFSIVGIGLILLILTLGLVRIFASFERWLSTALLEIELDSPDDVVPVKRTYKGIKALVDAGSTWQGLGFLTLKLWFGIVGLILLFALSTTLSMIAVVVRRPHEIEFGELNGEPMVWTVETVPETGLAVALGLAGTIFLVHLSNAFAYVAGRMSLTLLGGDCKS